jgi:hypothetical protein
MITIHKAIQTIHNNVARIDGNTQDDITAKDINGNLIEINWTQVNQQIPIVEDEIEQEKQDSINKKASGKQKLLDLGLTEEEVKALIGV